MWLSAPTLSIIIEGAGAVLEPMPEEWPNTSHGAGQGLSNPYTMRPHEKHDSHGDEHGGPPALSCIVRLFSRQALRAIDEPAGPVRRKGSSHLWAG